MIFKQVTNPLGQWTITSERSEYDAFLPAADFALDRGPTNKNPDRLAVAITLLFGRWSANEFVLPQKVGPNTAFEIKQFLGATMVEVRPIEYYPKPLVIGVRDCKLLADGDSPENISNDDVYIRVLQSDKYNGCIQSFQGLDVASNGFLFKKSANDLIPDLATAVLFAEDLAVDNIVIDADMDDVLFKRVQGLMSAARLGLTRAESRT